MSKRSFGFIYVLSNPEMDGVYKVGMTDRSPHLRAAEISAATGVPQPFNVEYYAEVSAPAVYEKMVHERLSQSRVNGGREFFRADIMEIVGAIRDPKGDKDGDYLPWMESCGHIVRMREFHASGALPEEATTALSTAIDSAKQGGFH